MTAPAPTAELAEELREYTAMKYAGDCKCGKCQLVPRALVERIYHTLNSIPASAQACPECDKISREAWMTNNPDGSVTLDAYHGRSREELKDRCQELCMALEDWQFAAVSAATDGSNTLENVREPYRSKIGKVIEAYSDGDEGSELPSADRSCTCHPDEAPVPCQKKYAFSECVASAHSSTPSNTPAD